MAVTFTQHTQRGTQMAGSTVVAEVRAERGTFSEGSTMRKIELRVYEGKDTSGRYEAHEFESEEETDYAINIGPMLEQLLGHDCPTPLYLDNPEARLDVMAYTLAVGHGELLSGDYISSFSSGGDSVDDAPHYAVKGALNDYERYINAGADLTLNRPLPLTRKPSCEIIPVNGERILYTLPSRDSEADDQHGASLTHSTYATPGYTDNVYVTNDTTGMREFLFANSLGGLETVYARTFEAKEYPVTLANYTRERGVTSSPDALGTAVVVHKDTVQARYTMSSGMVEDTWMEWWTTEFLGARRWWLREKIDGRNVWLPVTVEPSKSPQTIYDRSKAEAQMLDFTVTTGFIGGTLTAIHYAHT